MSTLNHRVLPLALLAGLAVWPASGCARHADFVEMRGDLTRIMQTQDQINKREEAMQRRLQTLEAKLTGKVEGTKDATGLPQRLDDLSFRIKELETKLAHLEEGRSQPGADAGTRLPKSPRQSETPDGGPMMPGTPDLTPTSAFNLAYNDYLNGRYELAISGFQRFLKDFSSSTLAPSAEYWVGESYYSLKDYVRAIQTFDHVITGYPRNERICPALYKIGLSAAEMGDAARARSNLKKVLEECPSSDEAKLAKNKLAEIR
jgi:tol-pal system protein YbgF